MSIEHVTSFEYEDQVTASYNEARMLPKSTPNQFVLSSSLDIEPSANVNHYRDYFGTHVASFDVLSGHRKLRISARSLVEARPRLFTAPELDWDRLERAAAAAVSTVEMMPQVARTRPHPEVAEIARGIAAAHTRPDAVARAIAETVGGSIAYVHGSTSVHSTAAEVWEARNGVCQDISHVVIGALRDAGIPARYVSGYLHPREDAEVGEPVVGESHAWVEWFVGSWQGFDPTNGIPIGDRHVTVGHGRDYSDVAPLRGVYAGSPRSGMDVSVTITQEA